MLQINQLGTTPVAAVSTNLSNVLCLGPGPALSTEPMGMGSVLAAANPCRQRHTGRSLLAVRAEEQSPRIGPHCKRMEAVASEPHRHCKHSNSSLMCHSCRCCCCKLCCVQYNFVRSNGIALCRETGAALRPATVLTRVASASWCAAVAYAEGVGKARVVLSRMQGCFAAGGESSVCTRVRT